MCVIAQPATRNGRSLPSWQDRKGPAKVPTAFWECDGFRVYRQFTREMPTVAGIPSREVSCRFRLRGFLGNDLRKERRNLSWPQRSSLNSCDKPILQGKLDLANARRLALKQVASRMSGFPEGIIRFVIGASDGVRGVRSKPDADFPESHGGNDLSKELEASRSSRPRKTFPIHQRGHNATTRRVGVTLTVW